MAIRFLLVSAAVSGSLLFSAADAAERRTVVISTGYQKSEAVQTAIMEIVREVGNQLRPAGVHTILAGAAWHDAPANTGPIIAEANDADALIKFDVVNVAKRPAGLGFVRLSEKGARNILNSIPKAEMAKDRDAQMVSNMLDDLRRRALETELGRTAILVNKLVLSLDPITAVQSERAEDRADLRTAKVAVLIELGNHAHKQDADQLASLQWRSSIARGIASALKTYFAEAR